MHLYYFNFQMRYQQNATPSFSSLFSKPISTEILARTRALIGLFKNNMYAGTLFKCFKSRGFPVFVASVF